MGLLRTKDKTPFYDPNRYTWAYKVYELVQDMHWKKKDVVMGDDVKDFNLLSTKEQEFIKNILRLFTQNDVEAISGYVKLASVIKPVEVQMMLMAEANTEAIHIDSYRFLTDTLGFDSNFYREFYDIPVMERKIDYLEKAKLPSQLHYIERGLSPVEMDRQFRRDVIRMVGVYAGGLEGIELMAQFMLLLSYSQRGLFNGMGQINTYSVKDENIHCVANSRLFLQLTEENKDVYDDELKEDIVNAIKQIVEQEHAMLDYLYSVGSHHIPKEQAKAYVEFMANRALALMELPLVFSVKV
jgi:ribonucleoside-diphosphate reductase beta chain